MRLPRSLPRLLGLLALVTFLPSGAGEVSGATGATSRLKDFYGDWRTAMDAWLQEDEAQLFDALETDAEREAFLYGFWKARSAHGETDPARWWRGFEEARLRFENLRNVRTQALLLAGKPAAITIFGGCADILRPLEIWSYAHHGTDDDGFFLVFLRRGSEYFHWDPEDGTGELLMSTGAPRRTVNELVDYAGRRGCFKARFGQTIDLRDALEWAVGSEELRRRLLPEAPDTSWLDEFQEALTARPPKLPVDSARLELPGRFGQKTLLHGQVEIPVEYLERNAEGHLFDRVVIEGDVWLARKGGRLVDAFEIVHYVAGPPPTVAQVPLDFYRRLRPGRYVLDLRVADSRGLALLRERRHLEIPSLETQATPPPGYRLGFSGLTRSEVGVLTTFPSIELLPYRGDDLPVGRVTLEAITTGGPIARVDFHLDGTLAGSDPDPPWALEVDLGPEARRHRVEALAFDPEGREMARHGLAILPAPERFAVELVEPVRGSSGRRAVVELDIPENDRLERLEIFLGYQQVATLTEPPYEAELPAGSYGGTPRDAAFVRAVATLASGATAEDLVLLGGRVPVDSVDVRLVELYTTVLDAQGLPVTGLLETEFQILEDGQPQDLIRFDTVENLAINVALLMDVSSSMRRRVETASRSARRFFDTVLTPKDRASLQVFNHRILRVAPFTDDLDRLRAETAGFRAWGTTRLYDSLVYTVHSFGGLDGKRALVLLSDGQDVDSDFPFEQVLEHTLRSGVTVYPILLGIEDRQTLSELQTLAARTGGRHFVISSTSQLEWVYRRIEQELRSQYLLVYPSPRQVRRGEIRNVEVTMLREGLRARTLNGYYP